MYDDNPIGHNLTGTVSTTDKTLFGTGTMFLDELQPGDRLGIGNSHTATLEVTEVVSETVARLADAPVEALNCETVWLAYRAEPDASRRGHEAEA